jgi:hypothetical protein
MKFLHSRHSFLIAVSSMLLASCMEESVDYSTPIHGTWKVTQVVVDPPVMIEGSEVSDAYPILFDASCKEDDLMIFEVGGVYKDDGGALPCTSGEPQQVLGSYTYIESTLTIVSGLGQENLVFDHVVITDSLVSFSGVPQKLEEYAPINVNFTLRRQ